MTLAIGIPFGVSIGPGSARPAFAVAGATFAVDFLQQLMWVENTAGQGVLSSVASGTTFTRASDATYFNSAGLLATAASNVLRFDYDPVTLAPRGALIEGSRTNLFLKSLAVDSNDGWAKGANTTRIGADVAFGSGNATAYQGTGSGGNAYVGQLLAVTSGTTYVVTVYARLVSGTLPSSGNLISACTTPANQAIRQNLAYAGSGLDGTLRRYTLTFTAGGTGNTNIYFAADANTTATIAIAGAQIEAGAFASSYIPTTTTTATRAADVLTAAVGGWLTASQGTFCISCATTSVGGSTAQRAASIDDGTANGRLTLSAKNTSGNASAMVVDGGATQADISAGVASAGSVKMAFAWEANDFALSRNGAAPVTDTSGTLPAGLTTLRFGADSAGNQLFGTISLFSSIPRRVSSSELQALSA